MDDLTNKKLADFSSNVYSQFGEDGIIQKIFDIIGARSKLCVEFGAWDGLYHSNTANLWKTRGWHAVLIEGDKQKYLTLKNNAAGQCCINAFVQSSGNNSLENILKENGISEDVDLLSIDIDGNDYYIFESIERIRPRVIICEYNPTIPSNKVLVGELNSRLGCSCLALNELAMKKGYKMISMTETNCFFIVKEEAEKFSNFLTDIHLLASTSHYTFLISTYDGDFALSRLPTFGIRKPMTSKQKVKSGDLFFLKNKFFLYQIIKNIYFSHPAVSLRSLTHVALWWIRGKRTPPPHFIKVRTIFKYAKKYETPIMVETGTYLGQTIDRVKKHFKEIFSVEISENLYSRAKKRYSGVNNVHLYLGDSGEKLKEIVNIINEPILFWLDGHYSGGITAMGKIETPIRKELNTILNSGKQFVILIDDARCFNGKNDYPTLDELRNIIDAERGLDMQVLDDIIRIVPIK